MSPSNGQPVAAIGFTVKSGWACAVLIAGTAPSPHVVANRRIELSDPAVPGSRQPYHEGFGTARRNGPTLTRLVGSVKRFGRQCVSELIRQYQDGGYQLRGAGIVVGSLIDPDSIGNDHIRIHALEGRLFRRVVEDGTARRGVAVSVWRDRDLYPSAAASLKRPEQELRDKLAALGKTVEGSWRVEHKSATLAAWLVLAGRAKAHSP